MLMRTIRRVAVVEIFLVFLSAGCSDKRIARVRGTIKVDGKVIERGTISFIPVDGMGTTAGGEIKDGKYNVLNVSTGTMKVQIRCPKVTGQKLLYEDGPNSRVRPTSSETIPKKYNDETELRLELTSGETLKDWDLPTN